MQNGNMILQMPLLWWDENIAFHTYAKTYKNVRQVEKSGKCLYFHIIIYIGSVLKVLYTQHKNTFTGFIWKFTLLQNYRNIKFSGFHLAIRIITATNCPRKLFLAWFMIFRFDDDTLSQMDVATNTEIIITIYHT